MKAACGVKDAVTPRMGAGEFDNGLDTLAAGTGKKGFRQATAGALAEFFGELAREVRYVTLQHRRTGFVELIFQSRDQPGMVMADVVDAITGNEIEDGPPVGRVKFSASARRVTDIHLQDVEEPAPLRVDELVVAGRDRVIDAHFL